MKATESKTTASQVQTQKEDSKPFFSQEGQGGVFDAVTPFFSGAEQPGGHFFSSPAPVVQAKLTVGAPDDPYEREADAMADKVVQRLAISPSDGDRNDDIPPATPVNLPSGVQRKCAACEQEEKEKIQEKPEGGALGPFIQRKPIFESGNEPAEDVQTPGVQRMCSECAKEEEEQHISKKSDGSGESVASESVSSRLSARKGGGNPLPESTRTSMESAFGADFSGVRIHTDSAAVQLSRDLRAQAFTHGSDVYFGAGKFSPGTKEGNTLLAHELTHTIQQGSAVRRKTDPALAKSGLFAAAPVKVALAPVQTPAQAVQKKTEPETELPEEKKGQADVMRMGMGGTPPEEEGKGIMRKVEGDDSVQASPGLEHQLQRIDRQIQRRETEQSDRTYLPFSGITLCNPFRYGTIRFVDVPAEILADFAVIPEDHEGSSCQTITPSNDTDYEADGLWWRHNTSQWLKVPDSCYLEITYQEGELYMEGCCNLVAMGLVRLRRPYWGTIQWTNDAHACSNPFLTSGAAPADSIVRPKLIQRKKEYADSGSVSQWLPSTSRIAQIQKQALSPGNSGNTTNNQARFIVDDSTPPAQGQMRKTDFLRRLNEEVCQSANQAMRGTPFTADSCPYIRNAFARHKNSPPAEIERLLERYEPALRTAQNIEAYFQMFKSKVQQVVYGWLQTGDMSGIPPEIAAQIPESVVAAAQAMRGVRNIGNTIRSSIASVTSGIGSAISSIGSIFFKEKAGGAHAAQSPLAVMQNLGRGQAMEGSTRSKMEGAFGTSFSDVEVHTDSNAANLAGEMNARAFTVGNHIAFGAGEHKPGSLVGDALMAHELAHVEQQRGAQMEIMDKGANSGDHTLETEADNTSMSVISQIWGNTHNIRSKIQTGLNTRLKIQRCSSDAQYYTKVGKTYIANYSWNSDDFTIKIEQSMIEEDKNNQHIEIDINYAGNGQSNGSVVSFLEDFYLDPGILSPVFQAETDGSLTIDVFNNGKYIVKLSDTVESDNQWAPPLHIHTFTANLNGKEEISHNPVIIKAQNAIPSSIPKITEEISGGSKKMYDPVTALNISKKRIQTLKGDFWKILIKQIDIDINYLETNKGKLSKEEEFKFFNNADAFESVSQEYATIINQLDILSNKDLYLENIAAEAINYIKTVQGQFNAALFRSYQNDGIAKDMRLEANKALQSLPYQISALYIKRGSGLESLANQIGNIRIDIQYFREKNNRAYITNKVDEFLDMEKPINGGFPETAIHKKLGNLRENFFTNAQNVLTDILNLTIEVQKYRGVFALLEIYEQFIYFDDEIPWLTSDSKDRDKIKAYRSKFKGYVEQLETVMDPHKPIDPDKQNSVMGAVVSSFAQDVSAKEFATLLKQIETDFNQYETVKIVFKTILVVAAAAATAGAAGAAMGAMMEGAGVGGAVAFGAVTFSEALAFTSTSRLVGSGLGMPSTTSFGEDLITNWVMFGFMKKMTQYYEAIGSALKAAGHMKLYKVAQFSGTKLAFSIGALQTFAMGHHIYKHGKGMTAGEFGESLLFNTILSSALHFGRFAIQPFAMKAEASVRDFITQNYGKQLAELEVERAALKTLLSELNADKTKAPEKLPDTLLRLKKLAEAELNLIIRAAKAKGLTGYKLQKMAEAYTTNIEQANLRLTQLGIETNTGVKPMFREIKHGTIAYDEAKTGEVKEILKDFYTELGGKFIVDGNQFMGEMGGETVFYLPESQVSKSGLIASALSRTLNASAAFDYVNTRLSSDGKKGIAKMKTELGNEQKVIDRLSNFEELGLDIQKLLDNYISDIEIDTLSREALRARVEKSGDKKALEMFDSKDKSINKDESFKKALKGMKKGSGSLIEALKDEKIKEEIKEEKKKELSLLEEDTLLLLKNRGFFKEANIKEMVTEGAKDDLRSEFAEFIATEKAVEANVEKGTSKDDVESMRNVEVVEKVPGYNSIDSWRKDNLSKMDAATLRKEVAKLREGDGQLWRSITEIDYLILKKTPNTSGLKSILEAGQVKSGAGDQHSEAWAQHEKAQEGIERMMGGDLDVQIFLRGDKGGPLGKNISKQVDFSTLKNAKKVTYGPEGKGFDKSLGLGTENLNNMAEKAINNKEKYID